jgi:hypothetical protein
VPDPTPAPAPTPDGPDHFLLTDSANRLPDRGPRYRETPADPFAPTAAAIAEPWNTATAFLFVLLVGFWVWRLKGRYRQFPFLTGCLAVLFAGAVGGTLYHATRTRAAYFFLDVIPISVLGLAGAVYLLVRLTAAAGVVRVAVPAAGLVAFYLLVNGLLFRLVDFPNPNLRVNLSYASLALLLVVPLGAVLERTRFRNAGWVAGGAAAFLIAWFCRLADNTLAVDWPMGTHWLWHAFGAVATFALFEYFYRLEGSPLGGPPPG